MMPPARQRKLSACAKRIRKQTNSPLTSRICFRCSPGRPEERRPSESCWAQRNLHDENRILAPYLYFLSKYCAELLTSETRWGDGNQALRLRIELPSPQL